MTRNSAFRGGGGPYGTTQKQNSDTQLDNCRCGKFDISCELDGGIEVKGLIQILESGNINASLTDAIDHKYWYRGLICTDITKSERFVLVFQYA